MLTKILFLFLFLIVCLTMRIPENDPQRNKTIIKVLSAYLNIGLSNTAKGYAYVETMTFTQRATNFINLYSAQPTKGGLASQYSLINDHRKRLSIVKQKGIKFGKQATEAEELQFASEIVSELDSFYFQVYGINTTSPDKYIGLINVNKISGAPLEPAYNAMRSIFGIPALQDLPETYQYFHKKAKRYTSQLDQDGVIEGIFELIGTRNKFFVEIGGGNSYDNTGYLRNEKGWNGLLFNSGYYFSNKYKGAMLKMEMVSPEKAVEIFQKYDVPKQLDFLSVDIDGNDYWVTKALLQYYRPAAISVEFNSNFPGTVSATIKPNQPQFTWKGDKIFGVSARAVYELGKEHGYSYVYHLTCTDIFLVRDDLLPVKFRGMNLEDTYDVYPLHPLNPNMKKFQTQGLLEDQLKIANKSDSLNITEEKSLEKKEEIKPDPEQINKSILQEMKRQKGSPNENQQKQNAKPSQPSITKDKKENVQQAKQVSPKLESEASNQQALLESPSQKKEEKVKGSQQIQAEAKTQQSQHLYLDFAMLTIIIVLIGKLVYIRVSNKKKEQRSKEQVERNQIEVIGQQSSSQYV